MGSRFNFCNNALKPRETLLGRFTFDELGDGNPSFLGRHRTGELLHGCLHLTLLRVRPALGVRSLSISSRLRCSFGHNCSFLGLFGGWFFTFFSALSLSCSVSLNIFLFSCCLGNPCLAFFSFLLSGDPVLLQLILAPGGQFLRLLDDFFLITLATELGDDLPATTGAGWEFDYRFRQQGDVILRPIAVLNGGHFIFLLLFGGFHSGALRSRLRHLVDVRCP